MGGYSGGGGGGYLVQSAVFSYHSVNFKVLTIFAVIGLWIVFSNRVYTFENDKRA